MHQLKIKRFLAHFVLDHIFIEYLKYSHHLTIEQVKLLEFILQFTEEYYKENLSLNIIIFYKDYQKNELLNLITHLYDYNWISKKRDPHDQRRLIITLTQAQRKKINQLFEDFNVFLEVKSKSITNHTHLTLLSYYFKCHAQFKVIEQSHIYSRLSLEELYILGLLLINNNETSFKSIKLHSLRGLVTLRPIIKKLQTKG